jgi:hypothetical protein
VSDPLARFARSPPREGESRRRRQGVAHTPHPKAVVSDEDSYARGIHFPPSTVPLGKNLWFPFRLFP